MVVNMKSLDIYLKLQTILSEFDYNLTQFILDTFYYNENIGEYTAWIEIIYDDGEATLSPTSIPTDMDDSGDEDNGLFGTGISTTMFYLGGGIVVLFVIFIIMAICTCRYRALSSKSDETLTNHGVDYSVEMGLRDPGQPKGTRTNNNKKNQNNSSNNLNNNASLSSQNKKESIANMVSQVENMNNSHSYVNTGGMIDVNNQNILNHNRNININNNNQDAGYVDVGELPDLPINVADDQQQSNILIRAASGFDDSRPDSPVAAPASAGVGAVGGVGAIRVSTISMNEVEGQVTIGQGNNSNAMANQTANFADNGSNTNGNYDNYNNYNNNNNNNNDNNDSDSENIYNHMAGGDVAAAFAIAMDPGQTAGGNGNGNGNNVVAAGMQQTNGFAAHQATTQGNSPNGYDNVKNDESGFDI